MKILNYATLLLIFLLVIACSDLSDEDDGVLNSAGEAALQNEGFLPLATENYWLYANYLDVSEDASTIEFDENDFFKSENVVMDAIFGTVTEGDGTATPFASYKISPANIEVLGGVLGNFNQVIKEDGEYKKLELIRVTTVGDDNIPRSEIDVEIADQPFLSDNAQVGDVLTRRTGELNLNLGIPVNLEYEYVSQVTGILDRLPNDLIDDPYEDHLAGFRDILKVTDSLIIRSLSSEVNNLGLSLDYDIDIEIPSGTANINLDSSADISGDVGISGDVDISGTTALQGFVDVDGLAEIAGQVGIDGVVGISGPANLTSIAFFGFPPDCIPCQIFGFILGLSAIIASDDITINGENVSIEGENVMIGIDDLFLTTNDEENVAINGTNVSIAGNDISISGESVNISNLSELLNVCPARAVASGSLDRFYSVPLNIISNQAPFYADHYWARGVGRIKSEVRSGLVMGEVEAILGEIANERITVDLEPTDPNCSDVPNTLELALKLDISAVIDNLRVVLPILIGQDAAISSNLVDHRIRTNTGP